MIFNVMIVVHEWGHFLAGRWRGLYIDRFQIWFGKPLWKKTYNGVQYGLGSIPAGGFVSLPQMAPMESIEGQVEGEDKEKKDLPPITPLDKIIVAFAGPLFSFLLAVVFACIVFLVKKPVSEAVGSTAKRSTNLPGWISPSCGQSFRATTRTSKWIWSAPEKEK
jgi:regulator of sigma E protease